MADNYIITTIMAEGYLLMFRVNALNNNAVHNKTTDR